MLTIENLESNNDLCYKYAGSLLFRQFSGIYPDLDQRHILKKQVLRHQQHRKFIFPTETHSRTGKNWLC
jgi:hypothetical protein